MDVINLQSKAIPKPARIEHYWFENPHIGLGKTLFHRIVVPFEPFHSGLDYVEQPESTELVVDWINLGLDDPARLDGTVIAMGQTKDVEASIYLGSAHNWTNISRLTITQLDEHASFHVHCIATVVFSHEGVAIDETFEFETTATYAGEA